MAEKRKGRELAEAYYYAYGVPLIRGRFADDAHRSAAGLVGPGSECFGYDDKISRDQELDTRFVRDGDEIMVVNGDGEIEK